MCTSAGISYSLFPYFYCESLWSPLTFIKPGACRPQAGAHLVSCNHFYSAKVYMYACVCTPPRPWITSGVILTLNYWVNNCGCFSFLFNGSCYRCLQCIQILCAYKPYFLMPGHICWIYTYALWSVNTSTGARVELKYTLKCWIDRTRASPQSNSYTGDYQPFLNNWP